MLYIVPTTWGKESTRNEREKLCNNKAERGIKCRNNLFSLGIKVWCNNLFQSFTVKTAYCVQFGIEINWWHELNNNFDDLLQRNHSKPSDMKRLLLYNSRYRKVNGITNNVIIQIRGPQPVVRREASGVKQKFFCFIKSQKLMLMETRKTEKISKLVCLKTIC